MKMGNFQLILLGILSLIFTEEATRWVTSVKGFGHGTDLHTVAF
ncbi:MULTISPECIES: hypothetical protein [Bacillales]|nr:MULTISPECIES: hypothetical protein [Bacillales]MDT3415151.1 hypothetical protein [Brevibacillus aydinogluensis]